jgi:hypothetical protein
MLLPSYFIIDITRLDELPDIQLPENFFLAYKITPGNIDQLNTFYKKLFLSNSHTPFSLFISIDNGKTLALEEFEKHLEHLVSLSFHYSYNKSNGDNPLFIFESTTEGADKYISSLRKALTDQGYNALETIIIDHTPASAAGIKERNTICLYPQSGSGDFLSGYFREISTITSSRNTFFFFIDNPGNIRPVLATIEEAEKMLKKEAPQAWRLLKENRAMAVKQQELQNQLTILGEKLESLSSYHLHSNAPDSVYKKQVIELQEFYNTEYEVLPLWFKRLGHIVKVLTGKRTFKSLYNDNVKKYTTNQPPEN